MPQVTEELPLLLHDESSGTLLPFPEETIRLAFGGAVLMDLQLSGRIDTDLDTLTLLDPTPLEDDLLDPALVEIAALDRQHEAAWWVKRMSARGDEIYQGVVARLVRRGILAVPEDDGDLVLTPRAGHARRYLGPDGEVREEANLRLMRAIFDDEFPDPVDAALIGLADACGIFRQRLSAKELEAARERIDLCQSLDPVIRAVAVAVQSIGELRADQMQAHSKAVPLVPSLPLIGNLPDALGDMNGFFTKCYRRHGPVFRARFLTRTFTILAGPEANLFMLRKERFHLHTSAGHALAMHRGLGGELMGTMNGVEHARMRREMKDKFSRAFMQDNIPKAVEIAREQIGRWPLNERLPGLETIKSILFEQATRITANASALDHVEGIEKLFHMITIQGSLPGLRLLHGLQQRRLARQVDTLRRKMLLDHLTPHPNRSPDLIDDLLDMHRNDPSFMSETRVRMNALAPIYALIDTVGNVGAFMLHFLLKHPDLQERIRAEADEAFADGVPEADALAKADVANRFVMETMRMATIAPAFGREVVTSFELGGYRIPAGQDIVLAAGVTHRLPECFPDPERFDIDRYLPGRDEHKRPGAYVPFGLGLHRCLGSGFALIQLPLTLLTLVRHVEIEPDPPDYRLKIKMAPAARPSGKFGFRVLGFRQPGGAGRAVS